MNVYDSERMAKVLEPFGYSLTDSIDNADLIIANTCSIREKARHKAVSFIGRQADLKKRKPGLILAIGGCVAQQEGKNLLKQSHHLDLVFGTDTLGRLPGLIKRLENGEGRLTDIELTGIIDEIDPYFGEGKSTEASRFVTIMQGCDNYCTYCVVPYTRGREKSRPPEAIVREIISLARAGVREVTLLGQNVNSYGQKEGLPSFAELLAMINNVDGLERIRFTTSHPKDFGDDLIAAISSLDKVCRHVHLPVQSGSDNILKRMNRNYTRADYIEKVTALRAACPDVAIGSDIIVGFPGETQADFDETLSLIDEIGFDGLFVFAYSDRPDAPSSAFGNKVEEKVKKEQLNQLLKIQEETTRQKNAAMVGREIEVLVEGLSKKGQDNQAPQYSGRTETGKIVNFVSENGSSKAQSGTMVKVSIERALSHSLWGRAVQ